MIKVLGIPLIFISAAWAVGFAFHVFPVPHDFTWWSLPWMITAVVGIGGGIILGGCVLGVWLEHKFPQWE